MNTDASTSVSTGAVGVPSDIEGLIARDRSGVTPKLDSACPPAMRALRMLGTRRLPQAHLAAYLRATPLSRLVSLPQRRPGDDLRQLWGSLPGFPLTRKSRPDFAANGNTPLRSASVGARSRDESLGA